MTPLQIEEKARQRYNAVGDSHFSTSEILGLIYDACLQLAKESLCIERTYTTSTVASQREYSYPTSTIAIKRVEYEGNKLKPINMRESDYVSLTISATATTGTPQYYFIWNETLYLFPTPSAVGTLKIFSYNEPQELTSSSTLEVPSLWHMSIVDYVLSEMLAKDKDWQGSSKYLEKWNEYGVKSAIRWARKKKRGDGFASVQVEEALPITVMGEV